jgi:hypothetical protein
MLRTKEEREEQQQLIKSRGKGLGSAVLEGGLKQQSRRELKLMNMDGRHSSKCLSVKALTKVCRL